MRTIAAKDTNQRTAEDLHRLALIERLPDDVRPDLGTRQYNNFADLEIAGNAPNNTNVGYEITQLRSHLRSIDLKEESVALAESGTTREALMDELRDIVARQDEFGADELHRLAVIESLPESVRPSMPRTTTSFGALYLSGATSSSWELRTAREALHAHVQLYDLADEAQHYARATGVTKSDVLDELHRIASKPAIDISRDEMRWIGMLEFLPPEVTPQLPQLQQPARRFATTSSLIVDDASLRQDVDTLRAWAQQRSTAGIAQVRDDLAAGRPLPGWLKSALDTDPAFAESFELDELANIGLATADLKATATHGRNPALAQVELLRDRLRAFEPTGPSDTTLRQTALEALDRDVDRLTYARNDGYSNYVDFADVGRATSASELLVRTRRTGSAPADNAIAAATDVAAAADDSLAW